MSDGGEQEQKILAVWQANASPWTLAVRGKQIASRGLVTGQAIVDAVLAQKPQRVIDLGCGEGWLVRAVVARGIDTLGVDAVAELVHAAEQRGGGRYRQLSYAQIADGGLGERADVVVCNFALLGDESVAALLRSIPTMLEAKGVLIVQTLHPFTSCGTLPYRDDWRDGSWQGCGDGFGEAAPWYFRTLTGWLETFAAAGLRLVRLHEPTHPHHDRPVSIIFVLSADA